MTGQKKPDGTIDRTFLQGLDLMLGSLIQKNDVLGEAPLPDSNGDVDVGSVLEDADNGAMDKQFEDVATGALMGATVSGLADKGAKDQAQENKELKERIKHMEADAEKRAKGESSESDEPQTDSLEVATDLGDKTNLPPEMGKKEDKGEEGLVDDGSIAEPMLRRREIRKAVLGDMDRGVDLFQLWADVDKVIEKSSDYSPHTSDVDILKSFDLCECTKTEDIVEGTLVYKMLTDRGSRPSSEWWNECVTFAKSIEGMEEPAFFAAFMYYEPDNFNPENFMKGLNDTGGTPRASGRGVSHDTEIDENIGAAGGQAIDGLGMSNDGEGFDKEFMEGGGTGSSGSASVKHCSHDGKNFEDECDCPNQEDPLHKT